MTTKDSIGPAATTFVTTLAAVATIVGISLPILQSDAASRRILSPERLQAKRQAEYCYRWDWTLTKAIVESRGGRDQEMDRVDTELLLTPDEVAQFVKNVVMKNPTRILSMELDDQDSRATREYFIFLTIQGLLYQAPLVLFGEELAKAMEDEFTGTAFCFITDASSGYGPKVLATVLEQSKAGLAVIREPLWMAFLANLVEKRVIASEKLERVLFGLCRLEASRVRDQVGTARTVVFTLPGQACTPALAPLLQSAFPCERHLFVYDGCVASVQRALLLRKGSSASYPGTFSNPIAATTPLTRTLTKSVRNLTEALSKLPLVLADTTEAWMASVDTFFNLKADERTNEYLPYVLKMSLLMEENDRRLALTNVLQFVTGSRSRPIPETVLDAAYESLRDLSFPPLPTITESERKGIEDCVFRHKTILIGDKTLLDTVLPAKQWTLKSAKKISGCACCAPDEDDEEGPDGVFASRPKYVDGKARFAFDPTKFG